MNGHEKDGMSLPARILLYGGLPASFLALVLVTSFLWGCAGSSSTGPSMAIKGSFAKVPRALSGLTFNHKYHTVDVGLSCDACHEQNAANPRLVSFPDHDTCAACHQDEIDANGPKKNCELCHTQRDYKTRVRKNVVLSPLVVFDHPQHQKSGVDCSQCHAAFDKDVLTADEMLPSMDACVSCHTDRKVKGANDCYSCHVKGLEKLTPQTHTASWKLSHGAGLTRDLIASNCTVCHTKELGTSCTECHHQPPLSSGKSVSCSVCHGDGFDTTRPADHTPGWVSGHGKGLTQTRIDQDCSLCHTVANGNDCQTCHRREAPPTHTIGWAQSVHGVAARTDRQSCDVCHDQSQCIACHSTNQPFTHTGSWGSPWNRHCLSCHMEGGGYVSGSMEGNCGVCHNATDVFARHLSSSFPTPNPPTVPAHTTGLVCTTCHTVQNVQHPMPRNGAACVTCHTH
ncbi:MAG TPA: cytochrome c3 family protein [Spirochaetia bacterium]|nr:cytochrome c3 family protein [Spirochaetia bacterium]